SRMLFSCLVDADFLDTEKHFNPEQDKQRIVPDLQPERALEILKKHLASKSSTGPINALRKQLLNDCLDAAKKPPDLFTLTAPTGSGKTLSSLAFALQHIIHHKPQCRWSVRRIAVKKSIRFLAFRRNEVKSRLSPRNPEPLLADEDRTQRNTLALR